MFENTVCLNLYSPKTEEALDWCYENLGMPATFVEAVDEEKKWFSQPGFVFGEPHVQIFKFQNDDDLMHFVLKWL